MKSLFLSALCCALLFTGQSVMAADHPEGDIAFHNASNRVITAQVNSSTLGRFNLAASESKTVAYSSLVQACSSNPTRCKAQFYADNAPAGTATINATTGELVNLNLKMKVHTSKNQRVLREVTIQ